MTAIGVGETQAGNFGHLLIQVFFFIFTIFFMIWNHVVTTSVKLIEKCLTFFKVAILCLNDSFAHYWHPLNQLHEVVTWNAFKLKGVPC